MEDLTVEVVPGYSFDQNNLVIQPFTRIKDKAGKILYDENKPNFGLQIGCPSKQIIAIRTTLFGSLTSTIINNIEGGIKKIIHTVARETFNSTYAIIYCQDKKIRDDLIAYSNYELQIIIAGMKLTKHKLTYIVKNTSNSIEYIFDLNGNKRKLLICYNKKDFTAVELSLVLNKLEAGIKASIRSPY